MSQDTHTVRYFAEIAYQGTHYFGWQRQPDQLSVQQILEEAFSLILRTDIQIVGCGRTDTGVHASQYFFHFDFEGDFPDHFLYRINKYLPKDIAVFRVFPVQPDKHARFDATSRSYEYHLSWQKSPFLIHTQTYFPLAQDFDRDQLQQAAKLLLQYPSFFPFCKSNTDTKTMDCKLTISEWEFREEQHKMIYQVTANRFLRGMVRLIVGMCINVAQNKLPLKAVKIALDQQTRLPKSTSAPPEGLFLSKVVYQ